MFIVYFTANMNLITLNYSKIVILADLKKIIYSIIIMSLLLLMELIIKNVNGDNKKDKLGRISRYMDI